MIPLRGDQIADALGVAAGPEARSAVVVGLATDSRRVAPGDLFLARKGEKDDGRKYVAAALAAGAALVVAEEGAAPGPRTLIVRDGIAALQRIASLVRARFVGPVVAIGGSAGKTSVKHFLSGLLASTKRVVASEKSFNNHAGVPMTLCRIEPDTEIVVVEIGTNHPGEIATLAALARPTAAALTAIGAEHLEGLGDVAGVLREELALAEALPAGAPLFVNGDDPHLRTASYPPNLRVVRCGFGPGADRPATEVLRRDSAAAFKFRADGPEIVAPSLPFAYARSNLLLAATIARELGTPEDEIARIAPSLGPAALRGEVRRCNAAVVWVDCYNANPLSAGAALEEMRRVPGHRAAVLGDMLELGPDAPAHHEQLGRDARAAGVERIVFVGLHGEDFRRGFGESEEGAVRLRRAAAEATEDFRELTTIPGTILLKASRGIGLERVLEACG